MEIEKEFEESAEAVKKHWWVFALAAFVFAAWILSSDLKQSGKISVKAAKWPIIGPYFFKDSALANASQNAS
jgi:hypothetical protein